ncbi:MAG: glutaredoxin [Bacteroidetes bacterium]|nr:MAG: glutaredoxin [Bacteroidota bacterium]
MQVEIYGMDGCGFCEKAVDLAEELCLDYTYIDANKSMIEFSRLFPSAKTVPQILVNGEWVGGYSDFEEVMEHFE